MSKYKTPNLNLQGSGPLNKKKSKIGKTRETKGKEKEIKMEIPINVE